MTQYITPQGYKILKDEFEQLKSVERPKIVQDVYEAALQGDRSENAEYIYGKRRMREIDGRLRFLSKNFEDMQVVDPKIPRGDKVFFGATLDLYDEDEDEEFTCQIVGPMDQTDEHHISYKSPMGAALIGHDVDDEVVITTPKKKRHIIINRVQYI